MKKTPLAKRKKVVPVTRDKSREADQSKSYTDKKNRKIEIKTFKSKKAYDSGVKDDPNEPGMKKKSSRLANTVELHKTKTKKDGTTKTKVKRAAGGGKKSQRLHTKFAVGSQKESSSDVTVKRKNTPLGMYEGPEFNEGLKNAMEGKTGKFAQMVEDAPSMHGVSKKPNTFMDMNAPGMYNKSKSRVEQDYARNAIHDYESGKKSEGNYEKKKELEIAAGESNSHSGHKVNRNSRKNRS